MPIRGGVYGRGGRGVVDHSLERWVLQYLVPIAGTMCVAVGEGGEVVTSSDPTGGSSAWTETNVEPKASENEGLDGVSCSSVRLCILTNEHGDVFYLDRPDRRCERVDEDRRHRWYKPAQCRVMSVYKPVRGDR